MARLFGLGGVKVFEIVSSKACIDCPDDGSILAG